MHQQINLYQPIFRKQRKLFSAATAGAGLAVVTCALASLWGFGQWKVSRLESEVAAVRTQQSYQEQMVTAAGSVRAARANPTEIRARVKKLSADLAERTRAMSVLRSGAAGSTAGFASRLEALARQHVDGLWLSRVGLRSGAATMSLSGGTLDPDKVPQYLRALASEPALVGTRFDEFVIERPKQDSPQQIGVQFRAGIAATAAGADRT